MVEKNDVHTDDVVIDEETETVSTDLELEEEEGLASNKLKSLREKLQTAETEKQQYLEDLQRARADFLNTRRRLEEQLARDRERAVDAILEDLLTLADTFDIATCDKDWETLDTKWKTGIGAIQSKLTSILKGNNVTAIDPTGAPFNPYEHEAVSNAAVTDDALIDTVVAVLQKGYKRGDDILRPARVVVGTK